MNDEYRELIDALENWENRRFGFTSGARLARAYRAYKECDSLEDRYRDLIMCVESKFHGEGRHATAKRYIIEAEST